MLTIFCFDKWERCTGQRPAYKVAALQETKERIKREIPKPSFSIMCHCLARTILFTNEGYLDEYSYTKKLLNEKKLDWDYVRKVKGNRSRYDYIEKVFRDAQGQIGKKKKKEREVVAEEVEIQDRI